MSDAAQHLRCNEVFKRLTAAQLRQVATGSKVRPLQRGQPIYRPGDKTDSCYVLVFGRAKIFDLTRTGKESILAFIEPGEFFGERALLGLSEHEHYVETIEPSTVVVIARKQLLRLMQDHADVSVRVAKTIGRRLLQFERRLRGLLFLSNRERLASVLLDLARQSGVATNDGISLRIRLSHHDLANIIGCSRETVSVEMAKLRSDGLIDSGRQRIVLTQPRRLKKLVSRNGI